MTTAEIDQKIADTTATLKLLKKLRRTVQKAEQLKLDLSNQK